MYKRKEGSTCWPGFGTSMDFALSSIGLFATRVLLALEEGYDENGHPGIRCRECSGDAKQLRCWRCHVALALW